MGKITTSIFAKVVAVFLLTIMAVSCFLSGICIIALSETDVYFDDGTQLRYYIYEELVREVKNEVMNEYVIPYHVGEAEYLKAKKSYFEEKYSDRNSNIFFSVKYSDDSVFFTNFNESDSRFEYISTSTIDIPKEVVDKIDIPTKESLIIIDKGDVASLSVANSGSFYGLNSVVYKINNTREAENSGYETIKFTFTAGIRENLTCEDKLFHILQIADFFIFHKYTLILICGSSFIIGLILFVFLVCSAGHKKGVDGIYLEPLDKVPLDVYAVFVSVIFAVVGMFVCSILMSSNSLNFIIVVTAISLGLIVLGLLLLSFILTFTTRIKYGKWWENTLFFRVLKVVFIVLKWFADKIKMLLSNIPMFWKTAAIFSFVSVLEFIIIVSNRRSTSTILLWWLVEKIIVGAIVFFTVIDMKKIKNAAEKIAGGNIDYQISTKNMYGDFRQHADNINRISGGLQNAVNDRMKSERLKTELITNVSHDLKTPLTSIVNYVDLMKKEDIQPQKAKEYLEVLDRQSKKLQKLTIDLLYVSKASTGNMAVNFEKTDVSVFFSQILGEYSEKLESNSLELITGEIPESTYIYTDGRLLWRVFDNLLNNIVKYAYSGTRVYAIVSVTEEKVIFEFKNISKYSLNITSDELMERFVRGDSSRNTEGSGLGLSIAKSLTELLKGKFDIVIDGDLFKAVLSFDKYITESND